ncbi:MAG: hypothetical protein PVJ28_03065, partial [Acidimicrobiia bacterium]
MKAITSALAAFARRMPWVVIALTLVLTAVLGSFAGSIEIAQGNEGFAPEATEISAQERIGEAFGGDSTGSTIQVIVREDSGDVITVEGLRTAMAINETVRGSEVGEQIIDTEQQPGVVHYLSGVEQAVAAQGLTIDQMTDEMVKQFYVASLDPSNAPPEQIAFLERLVSQDFDEQSVSSSGGMVLAFVGGYP